MRIKFQFSLFVLLMVPLVARCSDVRFDCRLEERFLSNYCLPEAARTLGRLLLSDDAPGVLDELGQIYEDLDYSSAHALVEFALKCEEGGCQPMKFPYGEYQDEMTAYTEILCSTSMGADPAGFLAREKEARAVSRDLAEVIESSPYRALSLAEEHLGLSYPSCLVVVEWARAAVLALEEDPMERLCEIELAVRFLVELRSRGYFPRGIDTDADLFHFLAKAFEGRGLLELRRASLVFALSVYPEEACGDEHAMSVYPNVSKAMIEAELSAMNR